MKPRLSSSLYRISLIATFLMLFSTPSFAQWTTSGTNIYNSNSGNVGIGTSSPGTTLHIASSSAAPLKIYRDGVNTSYQATNNVEDVYFCVNTLGNATIGHFLDQASAPFQISRVGNIGIGTSNPSGKLDIRHAPDIGRSLVLGVNHSNGPNEIHGEIVLQSSRASTILGNCIPKVLTMAMARQTFI
jgi:hypothetical protein